MFIETLEDIPFGHFDVARDEEVCAAALAAGSLAGVDNLVDASATFRVDASRPWRENLFSSVTGSFARPRTIVNALSLAVFGDPARPLPTVAAAINAQRRRTLLTESESPLALAMALVLDPALLVRSEYFTGAPYAVMNDGVVHLDLQDIPYADGSFAFVIANGVMEHVPDAPRAEREIARVLEVGGVFCNAIPFESQLDEDNILAERLPNGELRHYVEEPVYHLDPLRPEGVLVWRQFAHRAMRERFERAGCTTTYRLWSPPIGLLGPNQWIHLARKR